MFGQPDPRNKEFAKPLHREANRGKETKKRLAPNHPPMNNTNTRIKSGSPHINDLVGK